MPVDHFNSSNKAFYNNRYRMNTTFYEPGGPVILLNAGESGVTPSAVSKYLDPDASILRVAKTFHGIAVVLEHRFYGQSVA